MRYNTVIFDLDGTLLNTLDDLMDAANYALERYGYAKRTKEEVCRFVGNGVRKLIERALPEGEGGKNPQFEEVFLTFKEYYAVHCEDKTCIYEGVETLLQQLDEAGVKTAIVSNKLDSAVLELSKKYFKGYIKTAIGEREGVRRKPAPDMVELALNELGSKKEETVYIGDSDVDILTAAGAGLDCISVTWGFRDTAFLKEHGARVMADTPQQLWNIIMGY